MKNFTPKRSIADIRVKYVGLILTLFVKNVLANSKTFFNAILKNLNLYISENRIYSNKEPLRAPLISHTKSIQTLYFVTKNEEFYSEKIYCR